MNLRSVLRWRPFIYAFCALWIIFFHIYRRVGLPVDIPIVSGFLSMGNMGVDIFLFFSGCCNYLSFDKSPEDIGGFYKRRLGRLLLPYLIIVTPFWIWRSALEYPLDNGGFYWLRFFGDISSATFWLSGLQTVWFVFAIALFYFIFPLLYRVIQKGLKYSITLLVSIYVLIFVLALAPFSLFDNSSIAWARLPVFIVGIIAGKYIDRLDLSKLNKKLLRCSGILSALVLLLLIAVFPINSLVDWIGLPSISTWLLFMPMTLVFILFLCSICKESKTAQVRFAYLISNVAKSIGGVTLEAYMVHVIILHIISFYEVDEVLGYWLYLIVPVVTFVIVAVVTKLIHFLNTKLGLGK